MIAERMIYMCTRVLLSLTRYKPIGSPGLHVPLVDAETVTKRDSYRQIKFAPKLFITRHSANITQSLLMNSWTRSNLIFSSGDVKILIINRLRIN